MELEIAATLGTISACITITNAARAIAKSKYKGQLKRKISRALNEVDNAKTVLMACTENPKFQPKDFRIAVATLDRSYEKLKKYLVELEPDFEKKKLVPRQKRISKFLADKKKQWEKRWYSLRKSMPQPISTEKYLFSTYLETLDLEMDLTQKYLGVFFEGWYCTQCSFVSTSREEALSHEKSNEGHIVMMTV